MLFSFILACDLIWLLRSLLAFKWSWMGGPLIRTKTGVILLAVLVLEAVSVYVIRSSACEENQDIIS